MQTLNLLILLGQHLEIDTLLLLQLLESVLVALFLDLVDCRQLSNNVLWGFLLLLLLVLSLILLILGEPDVIQLHHVELLLQLLPLVIQLLVL